MRAGKALMWASAGAAAAMAYLIWQASATGIDVVAVANALTLPGVVLTGIGGLLRIKQSGAFTIFSLAAKVLTGAVNKSGGADISDDRAAKNGADKRKGTEMLTVGIAYLAAAIAVCLFA